MGNLFSCCVSDGGKSPQSQGITVTHTTSYTNTPRFTRTAAARYSRRNEMLMSTFGYSSESAANSGWRQEREQQLTLSYARAANVHKPLPPLPTHRSVATSSLVSQQGSSSSSMSVGGHGQAITEVEISRNAEGEEVMPTTAKQRP